jgi:hypothetical protein
MSVNLVLKLFIVLLTGVWRWVDGRGWGKTVVRNAVGMALSLAALYLAFGLSWFLLLSIPAMANILMGYTRWEDMFYNGFRFFAGTFLTGLPYLLLEGAGVGVIGYMLSGWLMGPVFYYMAQHKPNWMPEGLAEFVQGAVVIGGLAFITL